MSTAIVVVPCYNEASRLNVNAFAAYVAQSESVRLLFVDDGSSDDTPAILERLRATCAGVSVHALPSNRGKAEAVRQGLLEACAREPTYVAFWDADLATPLGEIDEFVRLLDTRPNIEMVFGSRVHLLGRSVNRKLSRHYLGRVFATFAAFALGIGIYDTQCGAKMFRVSRHFVDRLREPFIGGWIFDVELLAREIQSRRNTNRPDVADIIYEYPLPVWNDVGGSKLKIADFFKVGVSLARIYFRYLLPK